MDSLLLGVREWLAFAFNVPTLGVAALIFFLFRALNLSALGRRRHFVLWQQLYRWALGPAMFIVGGLPLTLPPSVAIRDARGLIVFQIIAGAFASGFSAGFRKFLMQTLLHDDRRLSLPPKVDALVKSATEDLPFVRDSDAPLIDSHPPLSEDDADENTPIDPGGARRRFR